MTMLNLGSTIRSINPATTLANLEPHLFNKFGITRIANVTGLDNIEVPICVAIRPNGKCLSVSQGKGSNLELAKTSAIMESIETWYAENIPNELVFATGTYQEISKAFEIGRLPQLDYSTLNDKNLEWVKCINLISKKEILLPKGVFSLDTTSLNSTVNLITTSSNGLASGNTIDEAICHSLCELVERDAIANWHTKSEIEMDYLMIKPNSIPYKLVRDLIKKIYSAELEFYLWDISTIHDIPVYYAVITNAQTSPYTLFTGQGAHFNSEIAMCRAITEACQARLTYISGSRDDVFPDHYEKFDPSSLIIELSKLTPKHRYIQRKNLKFNNFTQAKNFLIEKLESSGVSNLYLFDHAPAEDISVVHILSPELREDVT